MTPVADTAHEAALTAVAKLPTALMAGRPPSVRAATVFGRPSTGLALPLNRKTTINVIKPIPLTDLEPRQESIPVHGLNAYIVKSRNDPADVVHVVMRDGRERYLIQEGHTRLGAAKMRGDETLPARVWEFVENDAGGFDPIVRGRHCIGVSHRDKLLAMTTDPNDEQQFLFHAEEVINLPSVSDVSFPTMVESRPSVGTKRRRRKSVTFKGVKLSRAPMKFEAKVLALAEIPPRLDAAVVALLADANTFTTLVDVAEFGATQCLSELIRQGAPVAIRTQVPTLHRRVESLTTLVSLERDHDLMLTRSGFDSRVSRRRISADRKAVLLHELMATREPGIAARHAKRAVNEAFALGRAAVINQFRRPHFMLAYKGEGGKFISKTDAINEGLITVDAVVMSAVMDTSTCIECEAVDGEVMELGDDRQLELHPPYIKCAGGDRCRCVQIALLSDGSEIDVDEIDEDTIE